MSGLLHVLLTLYVFGFVIYAIVHIAMWTWYYLEWKDFALRDSLIESRRYFVNLKYTPVWFIPLIGLTLTMIKETVREGKES